MDMRYFNKIAMTDFSGQFRLAHELRRKAKG
jgi:hypothetical protein